MDAELEAWLKAATQDLMRVMADDSVDKRAVLGPVMMDQPPGEQLVHEFFIGTCGPEGFRFRLVGCEIPAGAGLLLNEVRRELRVRRFHIQSFDDQLAMARACEEQWPGANAYELRLDIEHIAGVGVAQRAHVRTASQLDSRYVDDAPQGSAMNRSVNFWILAVVCAAMVAVHLSLRFTGQLTFLDDVPGQWLNLRRLGWSSGLGIAAWFIAKWLTAWLAKPTNQ